MSIMAWAGISLAGIGLVLGVLHFTGLASVVGIFRTVMGVLADWAADVRRWLKVPGNKTRGACLVLGMVSIANGLESWRRGTVIVQQREDYAGLKDVTDSKILALNADVASRDKAIAAFVELAQRQQAMIEAQRQESEKALAEAAQAKAQAAAGEAKYREAFDRRPAECDYALQLMARSCPTLSNY